MAVTAVPKTNWTLYCSARKLGNDWITWRGSTVSSVLLHSPPASPSGWTACERPRTSQGFNQQH